MSARLSDIYDRFILRQPAATLLGIVAVMAASGWFAQDFGLDATTDSLTLENDRDLDYYRSIRARYGSDSFLIVTVTPHTDLFSDGVLQDLGHLRDELSQLPYVDSVTSILDVPLLQSPPVELQRLGSNIRRLEEPDTDVALARRELLSSPLYEQLIVSSDARTTAIRVNLIQDIAYRELRDARDALREKQLTGALTPAETAELKRAGQRFQAYAQTALAREQQQIAAVREVLDNHREIGTLEQQEPYQCHKLHQHSKNV